MATPHLTANRAEPAGRGFVPVIADLLDEFDGESTLKRLFWELLSYDRTRESLPVSFLPASVAAFVRSLEVFASSENFIVVYVQIGTMPEAWRLEQIAWALKRRLANCVVLVNYGSEWMLVYPDEATRPRVRVLPLPGPSTERAETARALAALDAADGGEDTLSSLESSKALDKFFPGASPHLGDILEDFQRYARHDNPEVRALLPFLRDIGRFPYLTADQERGEDLNGSEVPPDGTPLPYQEWRLTVRNLRLVLWMARRSPRMGMELADLVQEGAIGLMTAARRYDRDHGTRFTTYAFYWIRQAMQRGLHNQCNLIRWPVWIAPRLISACIDEQHDGLTAGERPVEFAGCYLEYLSLEQADPVDALAREEISAAIHAALDDLRPQHREVILRRFGIDRESETLEEVGQSYGVTRERIRQIEAKALKKLSSTLARKLRPFNEASEWRIRRRLDMRKVDDDLFPEWNGGANTLAV